MRILVVEDHPDLAANLGDFLRDLGHVVDYAADGARGLRMATTQPFDLLILDRMLPKLDGASLCRSLRASPRRLLPVLMLTAMDSTADRVDGFEAGADDYLIKPFAMAELKARVDALHRRATGRMDQAELSVADLRFDPATLQAQRDGRLLALNPTTRALLEYLMRNAHRVVLRAELEELLWGDDVPAGDVLRAHMHKLRLVIDRPFPRKLLHTVHGVGYRLADLHDD
ncbi:MAG: response regulator transcription factor [Gammaproteobacteria bacterium]